jgi:hypothetical protein
VGRPSKLSDELLERVVRAIRAGNYPEVAARHAGVHAATYYRWMERGAPARDAPEDEPYRRFRAEVERALADAEATEVGLILKAAGSGSWAAAAWLLERRFPERWGRRRTETPLTTTGTGLTGDDELDERALDAEFERLLAEMTQRDPTGANRDDNRSGGGGDGG